MQRGLGGFPHERLHQDNVKTIWSSIDNFCPAPPPGFISRTF
ncbi:hypothetical protein [Moorena sp. SIO4G3]|nr:hypothetical protein [Moorena sp. SIO4G3]